MCHNHFARRVARAVVYTMARQVWHWLERFAESLPLFETGVRHLATAEIRQFAFTAGGTAQMCATAILAVRQRVHASHERKHCQRHFDKRRPASKRLYPACCRRGPFMALSPFRPGIYAGFAKRSIDFCSASFTRLLDFRLEPSGAATVPR